MFYLLSAKRSCFALLFVNHIIYSLYDLCLYAFDYNPFLSHCSRNLLSVVTIS